MANPPENGRFIVEYVRLPASGSVKVTAIDPETGKEAVIVGPIKADTKGLAQLAIRKLRYVMGQK